MRTDIENPLQDVCYFIKKKQIRNYFMKFLIALEYSILTWLDQKKDLLSLQPMSRKIYL